MRELAHRLAFLCLMAVFAVSCSEDNNPASGGSTGTISGKVIDAITQLPIDSVTLSTMPATQTVISDTAGSFILPINPGTYSLTARKSGYANASVPVVVTAGQSLQVVIPMVVGSGGGDSLVAPFNPSPSDGAAGQPTYITLTWSGSGTPADSLRYDVYFGKNAAPGLAAGDISQRSLLRSGLDTGALYYWRVVVKDRFGNQVSSPVWSFRTTTLLNNNPPAIPTEPTPPNGAQSQPYSLTLRWKSSDPDGDPLRYDVLFGTDPSPSTPIATDLTSSSYQVADLQQNTTYYWRVVAKDNHNGFTSSPVWSFTAKSNLAPNAPHSPNPVNGAVNLSVTPNLRWSASDDDGDQLKFDIYLGTSNPPTELVASNHPTASYTPATLDAGTTYFWRVVAKDGHGGETSGQVWSFTVKGNGAPNEPRNPVPPDGATGQSIALTLRWSATDTDGDPLKFDVYLSRNNPPTDIVATDLSTASLPASGLAENATYYWRVVAKDGKGGTTSGPVWSFTTRGALTPGLIAYYPFNGNANDESGRGHHGMINGATLTSDRFGTPNSSYNFDGNDYIQVDHAPDLTMDTSNFTVTAWVKLNASQVSYAGIVVKCTPTAPERGYQMVMHSNNQFGSQFGTIYPGTPVYFDVIGNSISQGAWHLVAMVIDRTSQTVSLYVDGQLWETESNDRLAFPMTNSSPLYIGTERRRTQWFKGAIDEVRIYNYALSPTEIQALTNQ